MNDTATAGILDRLLDPVSRCLVGDSARALVDLRPDPVAVARLEELADKSNQGSLTPAERSEYESFVHAGNLIAILQAKARKRLL